MEQQTGSKLGKEYIKTVYCQPAYLTSMHITPWEKRLDDSQAGIKIATGNITILRYVDDSTLTGQRKEKLKILLMKVKEKSEKAGLKLNIKKN